MPSKNSLFKLMAILLAVGFIFGLGETFLRFKSSFRCEFDQKKTGARLKNLNGNFCMVSDPYLAYQMPANLDVILAGERFKTNSLGFRSPNVKLRVKGRKRVLAIGDSVLSGWGVAEGRDYTRVLETKLVRLSKDVEIMNFGVPGYNAIQESILLEKWLNKINPDLVIIHYTANDWEESDIRNKHFSSSSFLLNFLVLNTQKRLGHIPKNERIEYVPHSFNKNVPKHLGQAYTHMANILKENKVPSIVVLGSRYESPMAPHSSVLNIIHSLGFETVDLMTLLRGRHVGAPNIENTIMDRHNKELIIKGDGHPNEKWHQETAEILLPIILKKLF